MFVICLFSMLIYSPTKSPQSLIKKKNLQIELFKSSGDFFFHIAIYKSQKKKYIAMWVFSNIVQP